MWFRLSARNAIIFVLLGLVLLRKRPSFLLLESTTTTSSDYNLINSPKQSRQEEEESSNHDIIHDERIPAFMGGDDNNGFNAENVELVAEEGHVNHPPQLPSATSSRAPKPTATVSSSTTSGFPKFIEDYIDFHAKNKLQANAKYIIWRCPLNAMCGGTGDRIKGIMTAFYTALCTRRVLIIDWPMAEAPYDVSTFLAPHRIDWTVPSAMQSFLKETKQLPNFYSSVDNYNNPYFKNLTIPTWMHDEVLIDMRSNLWSEHVKAVVRVNDTQCLQDLWQQEGKDEPQHKQQDANTAYTPAEEQRNRNSNNNPHYAQEKYLFRVGFWTMFTFSNAVHQRKRAMQQQAQLLLLTNTVAPSPSPPDNSHHRALQNNYNNDNRRILQQERSESSKDFPQRQEHIGQIRFGRGNQYVVQEVGHRNLLRRIVRRQEENGDIEGTAADNDKVVVPHQRHRSLLTTDSPISGSTTMQPYIAVHIRTGIGSSWNDPLRHGSRADYEKFYQCAKRLQQGIYDRQRQAASNCSIVAAATTDTSSTTMNYEYDFQRPLPLLPIYVAADNIIAKRAMMRMDEASARNMESTDLTTTTIRVIEDMEIYHIDRSQKGGNEAELTVWAELSILLESTCLVSSRSGFSDLATWLQPAFGRRCAVMFNQCEDEAKVQNALNALDFPCPQ